MNLPTILSRFLIAWLFAASGSASAQTQTSDAVVSSETRPLALEPAEPEPFGFPRIGQERIEGTTAGISDEPLPLPGFLAEGGVFDATDPDVVITLRGGVEVSPAYFGSSDYELGPDIGFRFDFIRFPNGFEFGSSQTVGFRRGLGLRGSARYISPRDSDEYEEIAGLDNIPWAFEGGLGLGYEERNYRVFADVRYGIFGHNAWVGEIGADGIAYPVDGLTLTIGPRVRLADQRFSETYFGITPEESQASGLEAFQPNGGVTGAGVVFAARYLFNERWGVEGAATWDRFLNDAADSPIVEQGSEDQYSLTIGLTRRISLDF